MSQSDGKSPTTTYCQRHQFDCSRPICKKSGCIVEQREADLVEPTLAEVPLHLTPTQPIRFVYRNWRGEVATRRVDAINVWFGSTEWHPVPQWFVKAMDLDKHEMRDFAMKDMADVTYA